MSDTCVTCKSKGFPKSILGPSRCTFCDGTEGGNAPNIQEEIICPYCNNIADEVTGKVIYRNRPDLARLKFFYCANNHSPAYVGTHKDSGKPLGTLANASLRTIRHKAHLAFDRLWKQNKKRRKARSKAYTALAKHLDIPASNCHIGMFNEKQCQQVIDYAYKVKPEFTSIEED